MPETRYRRCLVALTALFGSVLVLWAVLVPGFRAPDEPQHFNSVLRVATGGGWPDPGTALLSDATLIATREAGFTRADQPVQLLTASLLPRGELRGFGWKFEDIAAIPPGERSVLDHTARLQDDVAPTGDQMTQHPPLYYGLAAGAIRAVGALDWRWDQQLLLLRLLNCLIATAAVPLVAATARALTGSRVVALVAAAGLVGIAQLTHVSSTVTNDTLTTVLGLATTWACARALTHRRTAALAVLAGALLGLGLLTKGFLLPAVPMVALAFLVPRPGEAQPGGHARSGAVTAAVAMATAVALGGWWWLRSLVLYGSLQPDGLPRAPIDWGGEAPSLAVFLPEAISRLNGSFWGRFGWLEIPSPAWLTVSLGIGLTLLCVLALVLATGYRLRAAVLLTFPVGTLGVILLGAYRAYVATGGFPGLQGRYLFAAVGVLTTVSALGAVTVVRLIGRGRSARVLAALPAVTLVVAGSAAIVAAFTVLQAVYQPLDDTVVDAVARWAAWSTLPRPALAVAAAAPAVLGVTALAALARSGRAIAGADEA